MKQTINQTATAATNLGYTINPVAYIHSDFTSKFGIPRQSGAAPALTAEIIFQPEYRNPDAIRGLEGFSHIWLIWGFSANISQENATSSCGSGDVSNDVDSVAPGKSTISSTASKSNSSAQAAPQLTVRPPKLGGNQRVGVFASRSPFRPNSLGLSLVKIENIKTDSERGPVITVSGADLMDGTPIFDIKPYVSFDVRPEASFGFQSATKDQQLEVIFPKELLQKIPAEKREGLAQALSLDPRPGYHHEPGRIYGFPYAGFDIRFTCDGKTIQVENVVKI